MKKASLFCWVRDPENGALTDINPCVCADTPSNNYKSISLAHLEDFEAENVGVEPLWIL